VRAKRLHARVDRLHATVGVSQLRADRIEFVFDFGVHILAREQGSYHRHARNLR
jgi:hypothetical protein